MCFSGRLQSQRRNSAARRRTAGRVGAYIPVWWEVQFKVSGYTENTHASIHTLEFHFPLTSAVSRFLSSKVGAACKIRSGAFALTYSSSQPMSHWKPLISCALGTRMNGNWRLSNSGPKVHAAVWMVRCRGEASKTETSLANGNSLLSWRHWSFPVVVNNGSRRWWAFCDKY